jgi:hypothetical protein
VDEVMERIEAHDEAVVKAEKIAATEETPADATAKGA